MKKNKYLNIALTTIMLLSTILTPQITYAISDSMNNGENSEETAEVEPDETADGDVEEYIESADDADGEDDAEVENLDAENGEAETEDEKEPDQDDEVADETPEDTKNNDPPVEEETSHESEEVEPAAFNAPTPLAEIEANIFTFNRLTHNGQEIEEGSVIDVTDGTAVELEFAWNTEGLDIQSGDTTSLQLPAIFNQVTTPAVPLETSGVTVGTYSIQNGVLEFIFNENIESGAVSNGLVGLNLDFNLEIFEENIEQVIEFHDVINTAFHVLARPTETASDINKQGLPDQSHNASEITWTVDVMNNSDEAVSNAELSDVLPDGLGTAENFVVTSLSSGLNGKKIPGETVDISPTVEGNAFNFAFDNIDAYQGYRVEYTTSVDDREATGYTNDATFYNGESTLEAEGTVSGLTASNPVEKSGEYNDETGQVDWTIVANENGFNIEDTIIEDELPAGLIVDGETFTVEHYVDGSYVEDLVLATNDFPIDLGETTANEHYVINFSTDIDYGEVNEGDYQDTSSFTNSAILYNGETELAQDNATVEFEREPILEKNGQSLVDYDNNKLSWTIDVNRAKHSLTNLVITDLLPAGLSISENDIEITSDEQDVISAENITINGTEDEEQEVVINLGDIGTQHVTINYTTEIVDFTVDAFNNTVAIGGDGIGEGDYDTGHEIKPTGNSFEKTHQGTDYNERTMAWALTVNPRREALDELQIDDTFPNDGLILLPDTLNITLGEEDITDEVSLSPNTDSEDEETGYHKGFVLDFEDVLPINNNMTITYETSYDPQQEVEGNTLDPHVNGDENQQWYVNHAQFTGRTVNDNDVNLGKEDCDEVREDSWNSGKKEGQLVNVDGEGNQTEGWESGSERMIAWELYMNYMQQDLGDNVTITDILQYEGVIDEDSVRISEYNVSSDGETTITNDVTDSLDFTLDVNDDEFSLTFNQVVDERYVVEFLTTVPEISEEVYTNTATVNVDGIDYPYTGAVEYTEFDNFLDKSAIEQDGSDIYIGDELNWEVQVNDSLSIIDNAVIRDVMSDGLEYVQGTLEVTSGSGNTLSEGSDYVLKTSETAGNETILTIDLNRTLTESLTLNYTTVVTAEDGATVDNTITLDGESTRIDSVSSEKLTAEQFSWVSGEFNEKRGALSIVKLDSETGEPIGNNPATFELYYELNGERVLFADEIETNENGEAVIGNLPLRTYYIQEVKAPSGYVIDEEEQVVEVTEPYGTEANVYEAEFTNTIEKTDITVTKEWDDSNDQAGFRPESIEVELLPDGQADNPVVTLSEENDWTYTWTELDAYYSNGEMIDYSVDEMNVPTGYEVSTEVAENGHITITNRHVPETTEVSVSKDWQDENNQDGVRPNNVTVNLLDNSEVVSQVVLDEGNNWAHTFDNLPKFKNGEEIQYRITENSVPDYSTNIVENDEGDQVIINSYTPEETSVTVTKGWNDGNNQDGNRPDEIEVQLLADGEPEGESVEVTAANNWTYTWEGLDLNADGGAINYTVQEIDIPEEYVVSYDNTDHGNLMIINDYTPEVTEIAVSKEWDDANNQDGIRPNNVTINLLADGEIEKSAVIDANDDWAHTFTDLPVYQAGKVGQAVTYTVEEEAVEGYETSYDGTDITNSYEPELIDLSGEKIWDDANNQDGIRPESITVNLLANGEEIDEQEVTSDADGNWDYTFTDLPVYQPGEVGQEVTYTVEEEAVEGYETSYEGTDITNSYTPELIDLSGEKIWDDADNQDGIRPESITVHLLANGVEIDAIDVTAETNWTYEFAEVPKFENGEEINYTVQEDNVENYSTEIVDYEITNSYTPGQTSVNVVKSWNDENNLSARPEAITVNLLAAGEEVASTELTAENNWQADFIELDEYANGELIEYTVKEVTPHGFVNESIEGNARDGFIITNRPAKVSVGDYVWFDTNKDGLQDNTDVPLEGVTLTIEDENGDPVTDVYGNPVGPTVTDRQGWYTFDNLPIDNTYIVRINREAFENLYPKLVPTLDEVGDDDSMDSSTWIATSRYLTEDEERDPTLDFGFVKAEEPTDPEEPGDEDPEEPEEEKPGDPDKEGSTDPTDPEDGEEPKDSDESGLPTTGEAATSVGLAVTLLVAGLALVYYNRKSTN